MSEIPKGREWRWALVLYAKVAALVALAAFLFVEILRRVP